MCIFQTICNLNSLITGLPAVEFFFVDYFPPNCWFIYAVNKKNHTTRISRKETNFIKFVMNFQNYGSVLLPVEKKNYCVLCCMNEILSRMNEILSRTNKILSRTYDILSSAHQIITRTYETLHVSSTYEIVLLRSTYEKLSHTYDLVTQYRKYDLASRTYDLISCTYDLLSRSYD